MRIEVPGPPSDGNEPDPLEAEWLEPRYEPWTSPVPADDGEHDMFILELLERAHEQGIIDSSDILSLGVSAPEVIKRLKERTAEMGLDFQKLFGGFDIG